ncbi:AAA domain-containing protein, partial [Bdellovibrionota bacterium FG-2]
FKEDDPQTLNPPLSEACKTFRAVSELGTLFRKVGKPFFLRFCELSSESITSAKDSLKQLLNLQVKASQHRTLIDQLYSTLNAHFEIPLFLDRNAQNNLTYQALIHTLKDLDALERVDLQFEKVSKAIRSTPSKEFLEHLLKIEVPWSSYCKAIIIRGWVDDLRAQTPGLRAFESSGFDKKVKKFRKLETLHRESARETVNNTLFRRWNGGHGEHVGLELLKGEANKQRRVLSPREIMEVGALTAMMKLKPCWLMSPLSISQMLPLQPGLFDIIIFDEASQVRVEDAVPSIYRCNSMVVVGDQKQMPPTNYFQGTEIPEDDEDEDNEPATSILDLASRVYPSEMLLWHYRSRSEGLIAFSNRAFYEGRLIAVPSPHCITESDALCFHRVEEAYFNTKDGNIQEAEGVVETAYRLLKEHPDKSLGVIAMGIPQMVAISQVIECREAVDNAFRNTIEAARNFKDGEAEAGFFVKNLENVQGDERDIILISVGYAPPKKGKNLRRSFGPLSKEGGGRRLNVAITRAKQQVHVFCSFDPQEIPTDEAAFSKNSDSVFFVRYLKYVQAFSEKRTSDALLILDSFGPRRSGASGGRVRKGDGFTKEVQRRLEDLGYKVSVDIGTSGFFIDLAIHNPDIPANFILGIECDGALFHSTPYARDRDKIRNDLLVSRGWRIERIWSQDWSRDWKAEIARLDNILKFIVKEVRIVPSTEDKMAI